MYLVVVWGGAASGAKRSLANGDGPLWISRERGGVRFRPVDITWLASAGRPVS